MKYTVYYQILSKKMKSEINADSDTEAKIKLIKSLKIIKAEPVKEPESTPDPEVERLKKMMGMD